MNNDLKAIYEDDAKLTDFCTSIGVDITDTMRNIRSLAIPADGIYYVDVTYQGEGNVVEREIVVTYNGQALRWIEHGFENGHEQFEFLGSGGFSFADRPAEVVA